jgi:hypothetical protein
MVSHSSALGPKPNWKITPLPQRILPRLECLLCVVRTTHQDASVVLKRGEWTCRPECCGPVINTHQLFQNMGSQNKSHVEHPQASEVTRLTPGHERGKNFLWLWATTQVPREEHFPQEVCYEWVRGESGLVWSFAVSRESGVESNMSVRHFIHLSGMWDLWACLGWALGVTSPSGTRWRIFLRQKYYCFPIQI